jgi:hypothetical protein
MQLPVEQFQLHRLNLVHSPCPGSLVLGPGSGTHPPSSFALPCTAHTLASDSPVSGNNLFSRSSQQEHPLRPIVVPGGAGSCLVLPVSVSASASASFLLLPSSCPSRQIPRLLVVLESGYFPRLSFCRLGWISSCFYHSWLPRVSEFLRQVHPRGSSYWCFSPTSPAYSPRLVSCQSWSCS